MPIAYETEIRAELARLPESNLAALLAALRVLGAERPPRRWSPAIGTLSDADADEMRRIIEDGCEGIDAEEW